MKDLAEFRLWLEEAEKSPLTVEKYLRDVGAFRAWLGGKALEKGAVLAGFPGRGGENAG